MVLVTLDKYNLNVRLVTLNLTEKKWGLGLKSGTGKDFLNKTLMVKALRLTINKWDFVKLKRPLYSKGH